MTTRMFYKDIQPIEESTMRRLLSCFVMFGLFLSFGGPSQAATHTFGSTNNNVLLGAGGVPSVDNFFDVTGEIDDLSTITNAMLAVELDDVTPGIESWHAARIDIDTIPIGFPIWSESDHTAVYEDDPLVLNTLKSAGAFLLHVDYDTGMVLPFSLDDVLFANAVLRVDTSEVPLPGAVWLLGSGLMGLIAYKRKK